MELEFKGNPKPFGIIGLVLAIISFFFSVIPCIGFYAFGPAFIATIFSLIAFLHARQTKINFSIPLAGLIIGALAIGVATYQYVTYKEVFKAKKELDRGLDSLLIKTVDDKIQKSIDDHNDSINKASDSINKTSKDSVGW